MKRGSRLHRSISTDSPLFIIMIGCFGRSGHRLEAWPLYDDMSWIRPPPPS